MVIILETQKSGNSSHVGVSPEKGSNDGEKTPIPVGNKQLENISQKKEMKEQTKIESLNSSQMLLKTEPFNTCLACFDHLIRLDNILGPQSENLTQMKIDMMEMEKEKPGSSLTVIESEKVRGIMLEVKRNLVEFTCSTDKEIDRDVSSKVAKAISLINETIKLLKCSKKPIP